MKKVNEALHLRRPRRWWWRRKRPLAVTPEGNTEQLRSRKTVVSTRAEKGDLVILSNGPGEVATWVIPVVREIHARRQRMKTKGGGDGDGDGDGGGGREESLRISVVFAPCPHASGREHEWVSCIPEVDRCLSADNFWKFIFAGKKGFELESKRWDWREKGVVLFLGGDQFNTVVAGLRLNYETASYCNEAVRWNGLINWISLRSENLAVEKPRWNTRQEVVGDLLRSAVAQGREEAAARGMMEKLGGKELDGKEEETKTILLLPGSKHAKLLVGVPYFIAVAQHMHRTMACRCRFVLPLAPTVTLEQLQAYFSPEKNFVVNKHQWLGTSELRLETHQAEHERIGLSSEYVGDIVSRTRGESEGLPPREEGLKIEVYRGLLPPYDVYRSSDLAITTVGTNTAELAYLQVPMLCVLPTHELSAFKGSAGGLLGLLMSLPGVLGDIVAGIVNAYVVKRIKHFALPNMWARRSVVPELVGKVTPETAAKHARSLIEDPSTLQDMKEDLSLVCKANDGEARSDPASVIASRCIQLASGEEEGEEQEQGARWSNRGIQMQM